MKIKKTRTTRESEVKVTIEAGPKRDFIIDTSICFFNHMIETIAWRACMNIDASYQNTQFRLTHVICEDVGIVMGCAFKEMAEKSPGVNANGASICGIDEAMVAVAVSFEGRANTYLNIDVPGAKIEQVEDMLASDLREFFMGFAQGARCTINIKAFSGENPHHIWEAIFRAFGQALQECFKKNEWRTTPGVKGK